MVPEQEAKQQRVKAAKNGRPRSDVLAIHMDGRAEQSLVGGIQDTTHYADEWHPSSSRRVRDRRPAARRKPSRWAILRKTKTAKMFDSGEDLHLGWRDLHDGIRLRVANVTSVGLAIATVTNDMNATRPREIDAPGNGAAGTTQFD